MRPLRNISELPRVVVLGGGTGSHTALTGLRRHPIDLKSVVSVMDSGGSSGRLRDEYGFLPPGDARQCLVALGGDDESAAMLRALFTYRFHGSRSDKPAGGSRSLDGHNLGNLLISALTDITGSVEDAYAWAGRLLGARGQVIPVSISDVHLCAVLDDGHVLYGEAAIDVRREHHEADIDYVYLDQPAYPTAAALEALRSADLVVIGPGDLYTSIIPNLLVEGVVEAMAHARRRIFVVNLMTKHGESDNFRASIFTERLLDYLRPVRLDAVLVSTSQLPEKLLRRYAREGAYTVELDADAITALGIEVVAQPLALARQLVRHDPDALAEALMAYLQVQSDAAEELESPHEARIGAVRAVERDV